jgi:hypothetical protein
VADDVGDLRGEVEHGIERVIAEHLRDRFGVAHVADDELGALRHVALEPGREVVEEHHLRAPIEEPRSEAAADETRASRDQNGSIHGAW